MIKRIICIVRVAIVLLCTCFASDLYADTVTIRDSRHYSNVFGEMRNYRIFLPPGYYKQPEKKYPVIYYMHGFGQRSFGGGPTDYANCDTGYDNNGDNIQKFVSQHEVIVVKSDGYNRSTGEPYYRRPYNITPVETHRQFPLYFPELISYIDKNYKTIPDREHRAISGLSMGGFMTFWISAKYPDMFSAAGSFCGSPEFTAGPKDFPVEYRHLDMYKNYRGMNVRLNYGDKDFIRAYHQDMDRFWPDVMDNYQSKVYDAEHATCGMGEMFSFLYNTFKNPPKRPVRWSHTDIYPRFSVWDYEISTDRVVPGFTILDNVDKYGFSSAVRRFVPDGELLPLVNVTVTTPPVYEKDQWYFINDLDTRTLKVSQKKVRSDNTGRIKVNLSGSEHEIGINKAVGKPNIAVAAVELINMPWAKHNKEVSVSIKLVNKGMSPGQKVRAVLSPVNNTARIIRNNSVYGNIAVNKMQASDPFTFRVDGDSIEIQMFRLTIKDDKNNEWVETIEIPVKKNIEEVKDFVIADGKVFIVAKSGIGRDTLMLGNGNGDGIANPGESVVVLAKGGDIYRRCLLTISDKYVNAYGNNTRLSDYWGSYDNVGGSAKYSVPLISSSCPQDHIIEAFAEYWYPDKPFHIVKQGGIRIEVKGSDKASPVIGDVQLPVDNIVQARVDDGAAIKQVRARFILKEDSTQTFIIDLVDDGSDGDIIEADHVFSKQISGRKFGIYTVIIEAVDNFGNQSSKEIAGDIIVH
jgi:S-formylglutathione hydrolase FrmB